MLSKVQAQYQEHLASAGTVPKKMYALQAGLQICEEVPSRLIHDRYRSTQVVKSFQLLYYTYNCKDPS